MFPKRDPHHGGRWHVACVPGVDGIWVDLFHRDPKRPRKKTKPAKTAARRKRR